MHRHLVHPVAGTILLLLLVVASAAPVMGAPFTVDTTLHVVETSQLKLQFALDCPERVMNAWYKPFSTTARVNGEWLPWEFSGQMIKGLWAGQGPIFSQSTDTTDHSWKVIAQDASRLVLRIESHATWAGQPNPRVRTDYTFWADSSSFMVERSAYFSTQNWAATSLQPYVFRVASAVSNTLRWRNALGVLQSGGFCGGGCSSTDWNRQWTYVNGSALSVAVMNHPTNMPGMGFMDDNDSNSSTNWSGPYTPTQAWTTDQTWRVLVHFSTTPGNFALEDAIYAWWTQQPVSGVATPASEAPLRLGIARNPAMTATLVSFTLPVAGPADVGVFDLSGRRVAVLAGGMQAAGAHALRWDGTSSDGSTVPPGLYLVRVRSSAGDAVRRLAWLK